ncbi:MAG: flagellar hook-length control protein FliK [Dethiobacter sp.]|jgi:hypothetical protein|nr:flagellar hook-length control protein FliK [Dethiobacter sp.]
MEIILPAIGLPPDGKALVPQLFADDAGQFMLVLGETLDLFPVESQKIIQPVNRPCFNEGLTALAPGIFQALNDGAEGIVSGGETDDCILLPETENERRKNAGIPLQEEVKCSIACGLMVLPEQVTNPSTAGNISNADVLCQEVHPVTAEATDTKDEHYHGLLPVEYFRQNKPEKSSAGSDSREAKATVLTPGQKAAAANAEPDCKLSGQKEAELYSEMFSGRVERLQAQDRPEKQDLSLQEGIKNNFVTPQFWAKPAARQQDSSVQAVSAARVIDPIVKSIQLQRTLKEGAVDIRVRLVPESLGEVIVKLSRKEGLVSGRILVETLAVKEVIENSLPLLKERLAEMNIELKEMHVSLGSSSQKEFGSGLPPRREWPGGSMRGKVFAEAESDRPAGVRRGILDILV